MWKKVGCAIFMSSIMFVAGRYSNSSASEAQKARAKAEGKNEAKAEHDRAIKKLTEELDRVIAREKGSATYFNTIIAYEAIAASFTANHGGLTEDDKKNISEFVAGISSSHIPDSVKNKINALSNNPPTIKEAFQLAKKSGVPLEHYDTMINFMADVHENKTRGRAFVRAWFELKKAA